MELHDLARHHVVSTRDATKLGLGPSDLRRMVKQGEIRRLIRGWYAVEPPDADRPPWEGEDEWETARAAHRLLTIALLRSFEGRVVASHQSALVLHGVRLWKSDLTTAHLCRADDDHTRRRSRAALHPACDGKPIETDEGFLTVPLATAVVQVGLCRPRSGLPPFPFESLVAADGALHDGLVTQAELRRMRSRRTPGTPAYTACVPSSLMRTDATSRSAKRDWRTPCAPLGMRSRRRFRSGPADDAGGSTSSSTTTRDRRVRRTDEVLRRTAAPHAGAAAQSPRPGEAGARTACAVTEREVVRFVWAEADDAHVVQTRLDAAIARARRRLGA